MAASKVTFRDHGQMMIEGDFVIEDQRGTRLTFQVVPRFLCADVATPGTSRFVMVLIMARSGSQ